MMVHISTEQSSTPSSQETAENASPKMDPALKAKWVAALRSGEYKQGDGKLHNRTDDSYCCLGVLCRAMGAQFTEATELGDDDEYGPSTYDHVPVLGDRILSSREDEELN